MRQTTRSQHQLLALRIKYDTQILIPTSDCLEIIYSPREQIQLIIPLIARDQCHRVPLLTDCVPPFLSQTQIAIRAVLFGVAHALNLDERVIIMRLPPFAQHGVLLIFTDPNRHRVVRIIGPQTLFARLVIYGVTETALWSAVATRQSLWSNVEHIAFVDRGPIGMRVVLTPVVGMNEERHHRRVVTLPPPQFRHQQMLLRDEKGVIRGSKNRVKRRKRKRVHRRIECGIEEADILHKGSRVGDGKGALCEGVRVDGAQMFEEGIP